MNVPEFRAEQHGGSEAIRALLREHDEFVYSYDSRRGNRDHLIAYSQFRRNSKVVGVTVDWKRCPTEGATRSALYIQVKR